MQIEVVPIKNIKTASYNPRIIHNSEFQGLKESLKKFGQQENFIVNDDMTLISGHQRLEAVKQLGWTEVTCNMVKLDKKDEKKLNLLMNSKAIQGRFDDLKLAEVLEDLKFDDDYESLRLDSLEPLDLSETEFSTNNENRKKGDKQLVLYYEKEEHDAVSSMLKNLIDTGDYGGSESEVVRNLVQGVYATITTGAK